MFRKLRYELQPWLRSKLKMRWWALKYGGKSRIPLAVVFGDWERRLENANEAAKQILRIMPKDVTAEEKQKILDIFSEISEVEEEIKDIKSRARQLER